jgi:hypothetical protein
MKKLIAVLALSAISSSVLAAPRAASAVVPAKALLTLPPITVTIPSLGGTVGTHVQNLTLPGLLSLTLGTNNGGKGSAFSLGVLIVVAP